MDATTYVVPGLPEPEQTDPERPAGHYSISGLLRAAVRNDDRSLYAIAKAAGIDLPQLSRFVKGTRGLSLDAADRLATVLRVEFRFLD